MIGRAINNYVKFNFIKNTIRAVTNKMPSKANHIVWTDLEMTGLDIKKDHILEIACLITDENLSIVATCPSIIIHQTDEVLNNMDEWCVRNFAQSGLTEASRNSQINLVQAEESVLQFLQKNIPENRCPLGGNSVYMDRLFLMKYMPRVNSYLHYRIIDVSSIKELSKRWYPHEYSRVPVKSFKHRAMSDIKETIEELKYYKTNIFKQ